MAFFGRDDEIGFHWPSMEGLLGPVLGDILEKEPSTKYMLSDKLCNTYRITLRSTEKKGTDSGMGLMARMTLPEPCPQDTTRMDPKF